MIALGMLHQTSHKVLVIVSSTTLQSFKTVEVIIFYWRKTIAKNMILIRTVTAVRN